MKYFQIRNRRRTYYFQNLISNVIFQIRNILLPTIYSKCNFSDTEQMRRIFSNVKETILSIYLDSIGMGDWWITSESLLVNQQWITSKSPANHQWITSGDWKDIFSWSLNHALWVLSIASFSHEISAIYLSTNIEHELYDLIKHKMWPETKLNILCNKL